MGGGRSIQAAAETGPTVGPVGTASGGMPPAWAWHPSIRGTVLAQRLGRCAPRQAVPFWMAWPFVHFGHFLMQRKQLLGIADRAEHVASPGSRPVQRDAA